MSYKTEFPDFILDVEIPEGFEDNSWHNNVAPSWVKTIDPANNIDMILFIDYADPAMREYQGYPRFCVQTMKGGCDVLAEYTTDDYPELLAHLAA
jgi:hypothetical protein